MAKAYLCPHCRARNRFSAEDSPDGVVCCGACRGTFLLPEFVNESKYGPLSQTAIVDTRGDSIAFDDRDTEIVELPSLDEAAHRHPTIIDASSPVPESEVPILLVSDIEEDDESTPEEKSTSDVDTVEVRRKPASETPTLIDAAPAPATETNLDVAPVSLDSRDTNKLIPPDASGEDEPDETPAAPGEDNAPQVIRTAVTQPTRIPKLGIPNAQPQILVDEDILDRPLSETTVRIIGKKRTPIVVVTVVLVAIVVIGAFYYINNRITAVQARLVDWSREQAQQRATTVEKLIVGHMRASRPDLAARYLQSFGSSQQTVVLRPNLDQAFVDGDWSSYRAALTSVCADQSARGRRIRAQWFRANDSRIRGLGQQPCNEVSALLSGVARRIAGVPDDLDDHFVGDRPSAYFSWIDATGGRRALNVARPIYGNRDCAGCHALGEPGASLPLLGVVIVGVDLGVLDAVNAERSRLVWLVGGAAIALILLLLAGCIRMLSKVEEVA